MAEGFASWQDNLAQAEVFKCEGNDLYRSKDFRKAMGKYHRALIYLRAINSASQLPIPAMIPSAKALSSDEQSQVNHVMVDCYNNLAACLLRAAEPSYTRIVECCDKALELSPSNVKALFRKGVALYHLQNHEKAVVALKQASALPDGKGDANINKYIKLCNEAMARQDEDLKKRCKAMFGTQKKAPSST